ncbi:MAG: molybdopterin-dependent oxidoreductase [Anaerolineae bacterium]
MAADQTRHADLAFHLALINVIISENLACAPEFVARNTSGFEELQQSIGLYTPEQAAPLTEIPAETIRRIAEFAAAGTGMRWRWRLYCLTSSTPFRNPGNAIAILNALVGNWGHSMFAAAGQGGGEVGRAQVTRSPHPRTTLGRHPVISAGAVEDQLFSEIRDNILSGQPYQAHGWFIARQNPRAEAFDGQTIEAFKKMDFIAHDPAFAE